MNRLLFIFFACLATSSLYAAPPATPTGLVVTQISSAQARVSWTDNATDEQSYCVERSPVSNGTYTCQQGLPANTTSYTNSGLRGGQTYWYRVFCQNCSGQSGYAGPVPLNVDFDQPPVTPDFALTIIPGSQTIVQGGTATFTNIVTSLTNWVDVTTFSTTNLPAGATPVFSPTSLTGPGTNILTITTTVGIAVGTHSFGVVATSTGFVHSALASLIVTAAPQADFSLTAAPPSRTMSVGSSTNYSITAAAINGFSGTITFSTTNLPSGVTASFSPATVAGSGAVTLTVSASSSSASAGNFTIQVIGTSGALTRTVNVFLTLQSTTPPPAALSCGIFVLGKGSQSGQHDNLSTAYQPSVNGLAVRTTWPWLDTGTAGSNYVFSDITYLLTNLQARGKIMSLKVESSIVPDYVVNDGAVQTYTATFNIDGGDAQHLTARPWDNKAFLYYTNFMYALSRHQVRNLATGQLVALRDHPSLGVLRISPIGREHYARDNKTPSLKDVPGYTRALYTNAVIRQIKAVQDYFPRQQINIGFFSTSDTINSPSLNTVLINAIRDNFNGTQRSRIAFFQELWTGNRPDPNGQGGNNLIQHLSNGGRVAFQALGSWISQSPGNWNAADGDSPMDGFAFGLANYQATYYEVYKTDVENADVGQPWYNDFVDWQSRLCGNLTPPPPPPPGTNYSGAVQGGIVSSANFSEASGLASSTQNVFWVNRDSGKPNALYIMSTNGAYVTSWTLSGAVNSDWEDVSTGPGPVTNTTYVYVAEHGGVVYRIVEPSNASAGGTVAATKLTFTLPGGNYESFAVDWQTGDAFWVARGPNPGSAHSLVWKSDIRVNTSGSATEIGLLDGFDPNYTVTAMDIARDGSTVAVLNKNNTVHVWFVSSGTSVKDYLLSHPRADAILQPGGIPPLREAMCITHNNSAIVTASESQPAPLTWWYRQ